MTRVKMKAPNVLGTNLHVTSVGPDPIGPGESFEVGEAEAKQLEARGLAVRVGEAKAEKGAAENKMEAAPANKGIISAEGVTRPAKRKGK